MVMSGSLHLENFTLLQQGPSHPVIMHLWQHFLDPVKAFEATFSQ